MVRDGGMLTPHILSGADHLDQRETGLGTAALAAVVAGPCRGNIAAPDEGNMYLLGKVGSDDHKRRFLDPLCAAARARHSSWLNPRQRAGRGATRR